MTTAAVSRSSHPRPPDAPGAGRPDPIAGELPIVVRAGRAEDAGAMLELIRASEEEGHLLPRTLEDLTVHASRFLVLVDDDRLVGCAELAPLSGQVAEVRSLVVARTYRGLGLGPRLVAELGRRARIDGYSTLCAFTHEPGHFVRLGFSIVPHVWLPEKIAKDCVGCPKFRVCGQIAVALPLRGASFRLAAGVDPSRRRRAARLEVSGGRTLPVVPQVVSP